MLTVVLIGAESTGKTTLAKSLADHYGTAWVPEYVRGFVARTQRAPRLADVPYIAAGHLASVEAARETANNLLILDTDLLSTVVYSRYYFGHCPPEVETLAHTHRAALYLLADVAIPWTPDPGQRDGAEVRAAIQPQMLAMLEAVQAHWTRVAGTPSERLAQACAAIDAVR